jgi:hypothetical protein
MAMEDITSLQLVFGNWYTQSSAENNLGGSASYRASVEYPVGTITQVEFSGSTTGTFADGSTVVSDSVAVVIPRGATFFLRVYQTSASGILYSSGGGANDAVGSMPTSGESFIFGTDVTDYTAGGSFNNQQAALWFRPAAVIGRTTRPALFLAGDSRLGNGTTYDTVSDSYALTGELNRSLGKQFATINCGVASEQLNTALSNYTKRLGLLAYCSHVVCEYGINDLGTGGRTASQYLTDLASFITLMGGKPVYHSTLSPRSSSTDSWATTANQTTHSSNAQRVSLNNALRKGTSGIAGVLEVADQVESARDSGLWNAPGYTDDGLHGNQSALVAVQSSGAVTLAYLQI